jgi:glucose-1-phosphate cytidylyltransferase
MKVVILCGGRGTRLREETEFKPKPMVEIGGRPILFHIMKSYAAHGFDDFVLCLGYKGDVIRDYFLHYQSRRNDFTVRLGSGEVTVHGKHDESAWKVTLVETGENAMTGARLKRVQRFLSEEDFCLTYGDGLVQLDMQAQHDFHKRNDKIGTVLGVRPPSRFGELAVDGSLVRQFDEKPVLDESRLINGGYFMFKREFIEYLDDREDLVLEQEPLRRLAEDGQLTVYPHRDFWQCMDTFRDYEYLNGLWAKGNAPWAPATGPKAW